MINYRRRKTNASSSSCSSARCKLLSKGSLIIPFTRKHLPCRILSKQVILPSRLTNFTHGLAGAEYCSYSFSSWLTQAKSCGYQVYNYDSLFLFQAVYVPQPAQAIFRTSSHRASTALSNILWTLLPELTTFTLSTASTATSPIPRKFIAFRSG